VAEIMASIRAKKALTNLVVNGGNKAKALRDAGYSEAVVNTPSKVFDSVELKPEVDRSLSKIDRECERLIDSAMQKDLEPEKYSDVVTAYEKLKKLSQLLGGKATENVAMSVTGFNLNIRTDDRI
jgi:hypothetical protein